MRATNSLLAAFRPFSPRYQSMPVNPTLIEKGLTVLLQPAGRWSLSPDGLALERRFRFANFRNTWKFMNTVAAETKRLGHHPEWANVYNSVFIRWTTHSAPGLTDMDVEMAKFCDERAEELGEIKSIRTEENLVREKRLIENLNVNDTSQD
ncbi:unnamed protein product [Blumeria hordei]|uniref:4a-hydroxytetrahydrobiopterin dehydratase n=1 Tax=Blumeria hordei TaxID=2867405 RepID=A0A383UL38_BLUHO|nr:unnamed protein product [Blumeria hordei]